MGIVRRRSSAGVLGTILAIPAVCLPAEQNTINFAFEAGAAVTDNIDRAEIDGSSQVISSAGVKFGIQESRRLLQAGVGGDFAYMHYHGNVQDHLVGEANGQLRIAMVPERITWFLEDRFDQARRDLFAVPAPENLENINHFMTGPEVLIPIAATWDARLLAQYERLDYQKSPLDTTGYGGTLSILHRLSGNSEISISLESNRTEPKAQPGTSHTLHSAALGYVLGGQRTAVRIDAGVRKIEGGRTGELVGVDITRMIGTMSGLQVRAGRKFGDNGDVLGLGGGYSSGAYDGEVLAQTTDPFTLDYASMAYGITGRFTTLNLEVEWNRKYSALQELEAIKSVSFEAGLTRRFGRRLEGNISFGHTVNDFQYPESKDFRELTGRVGLTWRAGQRVYASLSGQYYQFKAERTPNSVEERRLWLRLGYGDPFVHARGAAAVR
jgi:hypothetical protein